MTELTISIYLIHFSCDTRIQRYEHHSKKNKKEEATKVRNCLVFLSTYSIVWMEKSECLEIFGKLLFIQIKK